MNRRVIAGAILAVWLSTLGWFVRREYLHPRSTLLANTTLNISPAATYYRLALGKVQIGFASISVDTLADTVQVRDLMLLQVPALGAVRHVEGRIVVNLSRGLGLRTFETTLREDGLRFGARGQVHGDTLLTIEIESDENQRVLRLPLSGPLVLPATFPLQLAFGDELALGNTYTFTVFDPLLLEQQTVAVRIAAESTFVVADSADQPVGATAWIPVRWDTVHAWRAVWESRGMRHDAWIDDLGQIVTATSPMGYRMERTPYEIAYENFDRGQAVPILESEGVEIVRQTAIASNVLPDSRRSVELRVRLGGVDLTALDLAGGGQSLAGDTLIIAQPEAPGMPQATYRLPNLDPELRSYRVPAPLIQSRDPRIEAQARQIIGRTSDPTRATELLVRWVHDAVAKDAAVVVPSALDVFESRRGDCNEHTVLFIALARAVGLPARTAAGLVYLDGSFYYHAWPEVYLDGWVPVDPTFGQMPADATHLRFTVGGLARQIEMIRLVGRLTLEVVEARKE